LGHGGFRCWLDVECSFAAPVALVGFPTDVEGGAGMDSAKKIFGRHRRNGRKALLGGDGRGCWSVLNADVCRLVGRNDGSNAKVGVTRRS
jgi:hypothetical protein